MFLQTDYTQRRLIFPQPDPETNITSQLKSSLSLALNIFYPYTGRLVKIESKDKETASFYLDWDSSRVTFIHTSALTVLVSGVLEPADGLVLTFLSGFFASERSWRDLFVFILYGSNHMVGDGSSLWSFFKTCSEICRTGSDWKNFPPLHIGWFSTGLITLFHFRSQRVLSPAHVVSLSLLGLQDMPSNSPNEWTNGFEFWTESRNSAGFLKPLILSSIKNSLQDRLNPPS